MTALDQAEAALLYALAAVRAARGDQTDAPIPTIAASDLLEVAEAAKIAGVSGSTVRKWAAKARLTPRRFGHRLGNEWYLSRSRFEAYLKGRYQ